MLSVFTNKEYNNSKNTFSLVILVAAVVEMLVGTILLRLIHECFT